MAVIQCKICGGDIDVPCELTYGECPYCKTVTTFPKQTSDKQVQLFKRAEQLRLSGSFDKAAATYEEIIQETPDDADAYWGLVLSNWGIEYVEDPLTKERKPTCHRVQFESILSDVNYKLALDNAQPQEAEIYRREAQRIAEIQKDILRISSQEKPFDIFICYKETDESGQRTRDSVMAQDIYYNLTEQGYKVFFSRITLEDKLGQEYEPYIFAALNSAKVMLVLGTKKEFFEAVWVKNEWSRFLSLMKKDKSKLMIPCYRDMDAYDLPEELTMLQSQDMGKIGFLQDIIRGVQKVLPNQDSQKNTSKPLPRAIPVAPATIPVHSEISPDKGVQNLRAMEEEPSSQNSLTRPNMCNNNSASIKFEEKALRISKWSKYLGILGWPIAHLIEEIALGFNSEMDRMEAGMFVSLSNFCVQGSLISGMIALGKNFGEAKKYNLSYSKTLTFKNARFGIICSIIAIIFIVRSFLRRM